MEVSKHQTLNDFFSHKHSGKVMVPVFWLFVAFIISVYILWDAASPQWISLLRDFIGLTCAFLVIYCGDIFFYQYKQRDVRGSRLHALGVVFLVIGIVYLMLYGFPGKGLLHIAWMEPVLLAVALAGLMTLIWVTTLRYLAIHQIYQALHALLGVLFLLSPCLFVNSDRMMYEVEPVVRRRLNHCHKGVLGVYVSLMAALNLCRWIRYCVGRHWRWVCYTFW